MVNMVECTWWRSSVKESGWRFFLPFEILIYNALVMLHNIAKYVKDPYGNSKHCLQSGDVLWLKFLPLKFQRFQLPNKTLQTLEKDSNKYNKNWISKNNQETKGSQLKTKLFSLLPLTPLSEHPWPKSPAALTSAPASKSKDTTEAWPRLAAKWSAVQPRRAEAELRGTSPKVLPAPERISGDSGSCGWKQRVKEGGKTPLWSNDLVDIIWKILPNCIYVKLWSMVDMVECAWWNSSVKCQRSVWRFFSDL